MDYARIRRDAAGIHSSAEDAIERLDAGAFAHRSWYDFTSPNSRHLAKLTGNKDRKREAAERLVAVTAAIDRVAEVLEGCPGLEGKLHPALKALGIEAHALVEAIGAPVSAAEKAFYPKSKRRSGSRKS